VNDATLRLTYYNFVLFFSQHILRMYKIMSFINERHCFIKDCMRSYIQDIW